MIDLHSHRPIGSTHLRFGPLGLGTAPLGNLYARVSDDDADATLSAALGHGICWFDVAPYYGFGLAEQRLGRFLRSSPRAPVLISTKVGRRLSHGTTVPSHDHFVAPLPYTPIFDYSREGIERSHDDSLRRLRVDRVQLLLLHDIDRSHHPIGHRALITELLDETLPTMHRLKTEGRVDAIGLGINEWDVGYEILASAEVDCVLLAGRYTLLDHTALSSGFIDSCRRRGVSVLAAGILNSGFLAGGSRYEYRRAGTSLLRRRRAAAALQFSLAHPAITSVVVGARAAQEVNELVEWTHTTIPQAFWQELRLAKLILPDCPTPH